MTDSAPSHFDTPDGVPSGTRASAQERLATLFALSREVAGVLDLDELLAKIPRLIARLTPFGVFSVYLLDDAAQELRIAYAEGYPEEAAKAVRPEARAGHGRHGGAGAALDPAERRAQRPALYRSWRRARSPRWSVPLRHKSKVLGALNLLSNELNAFDDDDESMLRVFAASIAQAHRQRPAVRPRRSSTPRRWRRWPRSAAR